jgi:hypothetical protein
MTDAYIEKVSGRGGRKPKTPERAAELVKAAQEMASSIEQMAANGLTPQEISLLTGIKPDRLYRKYKDCMMAGGARRTNEVAQSAYLMSVGGPEKNWRQADAGMAKFWLERRGGPVWAAPRPDAQEGPDLTRLSVPQLIELERALRPLARNPVMIDGAIERVAEPRGGSGGVNASGVGDLDDAGVGERVGGEGSVPE